MKIECKGFKPYKHQRAVINEVIDKPNSSKTVVVLSSRQKGKSFMIANIALWKVFTGKRKIVIIVSPTLKQSKNIFKTIEEAVAGLPIVRNINGSDYLISFVNGSMIYFKSAEQREALRGYTADLVCIDECAFIPDDIWHICQPWRDFKRATVLMVSTPYVREGWFYEYYNYGIEGINNTVTIDWSSEEFREDIEKILPPERLEEYRKIMPKNQFKTEYLGQWLDDEGVVFGNFKECIKENKLNNTDKLYIGVDWASGVDADETVISIINQKGEQVYIDGFNQLNTTQTIDRIINILKPHYNQIVSIKPELNSIGRQFTDLLLEKLPINIKSKVDGFTTSNSSKSELVSELQVAFENSKIKILDDAKQIRQLSTYSAEYNPKTKNVSYNAPRGLNDDRVMGLMLSWKAYNERKIKGAYSIGISRLR